MNLSSQRKQIDAIDTQITELLCRRLDIAAEIAMEKAAHGAPMFDAAREEAIISRLSALATAEKAPHIRKIYAAILSESKARQSAAVSATESRRDRL